MNSISELVNMDSNDGEEAATPLPSHCRAIYALPTASSSGFWSLCMVTLTRESRPVNSNGAS
jgi:hypothetical protein